MNTIIDSERACRGELCKCRTRPPVVLHEGLPTWVTVAIAIGAAVVGTGLGILIGSFLY